MGLLVPEIKIDEYSNLLQLGLITPSSHFIPFIHPTKGVAVAPYCYECEDYWSKPNASMISFNTNIVKGFDPFTNERVTLKGANTEAALVEYKKFGERTGRTVNPIGNRRFLVTPPIIGVSSDDTPIFINWLINDSLEYYQGLLNHFEQLKRTLFAIIVRGLVN